MNPGVGPWLVRLGALLVVIGVLAWTGLLSWFGRIPGDIRIVRDNVHVYVPIASMILVSVVVSLVLWLVNR
jgi:purine-cytosine permease-like protein